MSSASTRPGAGPSPSSWEPSGMGAWDRRSAVLWAAIRDSYICCIMPISVCSPSGRPSARRKKGSVADSCVHPWETKRTTRGATVAKTVAGRRKAPMRLMVLPEADTHS